MINLENNTLKNGKLNTLYSYAYEKGVNLAEISKYDEMCTTYLDSGAFSAFTVGKEVSLPQFTNYVDTMKTHLQNSVYFQLDVIGDPVATANNLKTMQGNGYEPIPVFTRGASIKQWKNLTDGSHDLISLGGVSGGSENTDGYVKWIMNRLPAEQKIHWLGYAKDPMLKAFKPYSFDSVNWKWVLMFGRMPIWDGRKLTWYNRKDFTNYKSPKTKHAIRSLRKAMETILVDPTEFADPEELCCGSEAHWSSKNSMWPSLAVQLSVISYLKFAWDVEQTLGSKYVFVYTKTMELELICEIFKKTKFYAKSNS